MDDERKIEAHGSQIGGIGDDWHVEGGIHFHGPSLPQSLHQIPDPPRYFKGREKEIDELVAAARETGAIISGLGGIGKTTLAYKLAHELAGDYPDAQLLVGLNGTSASPLFAADAMGQIIHAFHPQADLPASQSKRSGLYRSVLHGKRAVLLLDDAADADQIEPLVPPASCALIITSRTRFQIPGMHALNLGMLGKEEARMLLLEISPRVHDYADEIAELCGYLPLALEIAASAMAERVDLAPAEYTRRLRDERKRLDLVDASLSLSYDLLDERLQRLWARLSVFSIPFEREAAAAVWELELDAAVDHLGQLLRYSLIDWRENVGRYDFHDLARIFAYQKLQEIEDPRSIHRLAAAYFETKITDEESEVTASEVLEAIDQWERAEDWEQFAWRCARLARGFHRVGSWEEITDRLERALRAVRERLDNPGLETALLNELGTITWKKGEWDKAIDIFEENLKILEQLGDVHGKGHTWGALGNIYVDKREWAQAMDMYRKSLSALEQVDDRWGLAQGWGNLGNAYALKREWEQAIREYRRSLAMKRSLGDLRGIADTLLNLGNIDFERRDWDRATEIYEEALEIFQHLGVLQSVAHALASLGRVCVQKDEWNRATEVLEQSLEIYEQVGDAHGIATVRGVLGTLHAEKREWDRAIRLYDQSMETFRRLGDTHGLAMTLMSLGNIYADRGEWDQAVEMHEQGLEVLEQLGDIYGMTQVRMNLGGVYSRKRKWERAIELYEQSLETFRRMGAVRPMAEGFSNLGLAYEHKGELELALKMYEQSLEMMERLEDPVGTAHALNNLGVIHHRMGQFDRAIERYEQSLKIFDRLEDARGIANTQMLLGNVYADEGEWDAALEMYEQSLEATKRLGNPHYIAQVLGNLGNFYAAQGDKEQAASYLAGAYVLFAQLGAVPEAQKTAMHLAQVLGSVGAARAYLVQYVQGYEPSE